MRWLGFGAVFLGIAGSTLAVAACASDSASELGATSPDSGLRGDAGPTRDAGSISDGGAMVEANAVVLVHAASFPAFRLCFENAGQELPQPSADVMPESNVVGVDVGTAVRLPPRTEMLGQAYVYQESYLRPLYTLGGEGPTCAQLLSAAATKSAALPVGEVTASLARGVHALVLTGCREAAADNVASTERCGEGWSPTTSNLALRTITLPAYARQDPSRLPVQLLQLSPSLARSAAGRALGVAFGSLDGGAVSPSPFIEGAVPFGKPVPTPPAQLDYAEADLGAFATTGVFVTLGGPVDEAGAPVGSGADGGGQRDVVLVQSLADIQKRSSARAVPPDWFATASSYIVLSVGDLDPRTADGGPDGDPRRALHLLAFPLATQGAGAPAASR